MNNTVIAADWAELYSSINERWLDPFGGIPELTGDYDNHINRVLPHVGTPNSLGLVKFEFYLEASSPHENVTVFPRWTKVPMRNGNVVSNLNLPTLMPNGYMHTMGVRATDVYGNQARAKGKEK